MPADEREWLEADGSGGFAMGTVSGIRTRRYHALLTAATAPPSGRMTLVAGVEAWIDTDEDTVALSSHRYHPDVVWPDGASRIADFRHDPWPTWRYAAGPAEVVHELFCERASGEVVLTWRLVSPGSANLHVRPLLAARDYHALQRESPGIRWEARVAGGNAAWEPHGPLTAASALTNGTYSHEPEWYRGFLYTTERERGLDHIEDLASPGLFRFALTPDEPEAVMVLRAGAAPYGDAAAIAERARAAERKRRDDLPDPLARAGAQYLVRRGAGLSVIAGYPWFTDWGRDTFIAARGLLLATGRLADARRVLLAWAETVSEGMLPNRFPDGDAPPEYNAVDASLWYVVVVGELLDATPLGPGDRERLAGTVGEIVRGYTEGTRFGIRADGDGLIAAGEPGVQLTWMDARIGERVITPRMGKPVEIQALWINALAVAERLGGAIPGLRERALASFRERFPTGDGGLYDVVDEGHVPGRVDASFRANQIFAVGGLPEPILEGNLARTVVDEVERRLWTPAGLRSLDPGDPAYRGRYDGGVEERDAAYHQGTVWPWLAGPFVEAWLRVRGRGASARAEARRRLYEPLASRVGSPGLGHVAEIADGDPPHSPRGAPFQAWSLSELLRIRTWLHPSDHRTR